MRDAARFGTRPIAESLAALALSTVPARAPARVANAARILSIVPASSSGSSSSSTAASCGAVRTRFASRTIPGLR